MVLGKGVINNSNTSETDPFQIITDNAGNVIETGIFEGNVTFGNINIHTSAPVNAYIVKYDNNGNAMWAHAPIADIQQNVFGNSVSCDNLGYITLAGTYYDTVLFGSIILSAANYATFITKYSPSGAVLWAVTNSGKGEVYPYFIKQDNYGNTYVTGIFRDSVAFGLFKVYESSSQYHFFLAKLDHSGNFLWVRTSLYYGPNENDLGSTLAIDTLGNIYVAGQFSDTMSIGTYTLISKRLSNIFLAKYDSAGNLIWIRSATESSSAVAYSFAGSQSFCGGGLDIDNAGNLYMAGLFSDTLQFGSFILLPNSTLDGVFIVKYAPSGKVVWAKENKPYRNGRAYAEPYSISCSKYGGFYLCGTFGDTLTFNSVSLISKKTEPSFLFKFDTSGNAVCGSTINNGNDDNNSVAADPLFNDVFFNGDVESFGNGASCYFGSDSIIGTGVEYSFLAKWMCTDCSSVLMDSVNFRNASCSGKNNGSASMFVSGGTRQYAYVWSPGGGNDSVASNLSAGTYTVQCFDRNGCDITDTVTIKVSPPPAINVCCNTSIVYGQSVQLTTSGSGAYQWSPSAGLSCDTCPNPDASPMQTTTYTLTITSDSGCIAASTITIDVTCGEVFVPDVFSPGGDYNKILYVRGPCIAEIDFMVFDRWGNKVFETQNENMGWDGTCKGQLMNMGTYMYYVKAALLDGTNVEKKGNVTLVR